MRSSGSIFEFYRNKILDLIRKRKQKKVWTFPESKQTTKNKQANKQTSKNENKNLRNIKVTVIPIIVRVLGTFSNSLEHTGGTID